MSIQALVRVETSGNEVFDFLQVGEEYRIDSRAVAPGLGIEHESFMKTLRTYQTDLEDFGKLRFEIGSSSSGQHQNYVMLNRNQVLFAITLSRNTEQVVKWKKALIDALSQLEQQLAATSRPLQIGMGNRGFVQRVRTTEELDALIVERVRRYEKNYSCPPTASDLRKYYLSRSLTTEQIKVRLELLAESGTLRKISKSYTTFYTLTDL